MRGKPSPQEEKRLGDKALAAIQFGQMRLDNRHTEAAKRKFDTPPYCFGDRRREWEAMRDAKSISEERGNQGISTEFE